MTDSDQTDDDHRKQGVELGEFDERLEAHEYPITVGELVEADGDVELGLPDRDETVRETLGLLPDDQTFDDPEEARDAILNTVGSEAVGRAGYSDRGGTLPEETDAAEQDDESM